MMQLKTDKDCKNFGFVETWRTYSYDTGAVMVMAVVNAGKYLAEPYIFRGGSFVKAEDIDKEMGIEKYIKAKKPFYSLLGTGNLIVDMRVCYDLKTKEYIPDKSTYKLYGVVKDTLEYVKDKSWVVKIRRISSTNDSIVEWLNDMGKRIAKCGGDREEFLKSRFVGDRVNEA